MRWLPLALFLAAPAWAQTPSDAPATSDASETSDRGTASDAPRPGRGVSPSEPGALRFDPATDMWRMSAAEAITAVARKRPLSTDFLGRVDALSRYGRFGHAWFADDLDLTAFERLTVAPIRNSLGRPRLPGDRTLQSALVALLTKATPGPAVEAGDDGDLTLFIDVLTRVSTRWRLAEVVQVLGVDRQDRIVFRQQFLVEVDGADGVALDAIFQGPTGSGTSTPDDKDAYAWIAQVAHQAAGRIQGALKKYGADYAKGKEPIGGGPVPLPHPRSYYLPDPDERLGDALQRQVDSYLELALDPRRDRELRDAAIRDLGRLGASRVIEPLSELLTRKEQGGRGLRHAVLWTLGELADPAALPWIDAATGVGKAHVRMARSKIVKL